MGSQYYVICSMDDSGAECATWEEAAELCNELRRSGEEPRIVGGKLNTPLMINGHLDDAIDRVDPPSWANWEV